MDNYQTYLPGAIFNTSILCLVVFIWRYISNHYLWPITINKFRFRLFAIRDEVNFMVVSGKLSEDSKSYKYFIGFLNSYIKSLSNYSILTVLKDLATIQRDEELQKNLGEIRAEICKNEKVKNLHVESVLVLNQLLKETSFFMKNSYQIYLFFQIKFHIQNKFVESVRSGLKLIKSLSSENSLYESDSIPLNS